MQTIDIQVFLASFILTVLFILILKPLAVIIGLMDSPCSRKQHNEKIPLIGGVSIFLTVLIVNLWWGELKNIPYLVAATLIVIVGVIDDYKTLDFKLRLVAEIIAASIMIYWGGVQIDSLGDLLGYGEIRLGVFSEIFTIFAIVGGINAFNMIDGMDGLAGSVALITFSLLFFVDSSFNSGHMLSNIFIPAIISFLLFNFPAFGRKKASVFLGDAGSMLFGFTICWILISMSQGEHKAIAPVTVLWILAGVLFDSVAIMIRRKRNGRSPFAPDREHFHHIFKVAGYSTKQTLFIIVVWVIALGVFGLLGEKKANFTEGTMFLVFLSIFGLYYWGLSHAWITMKIARYLKDKDHKSERRKGDRRKEIKGYDGEDRRKLHDRRTGKDRRYQDAIRIMERKEIPIYRKKIQFLNVKNWFL